MEELTQDDGNERGKNGNHYESITTLIYIYIYIQNLKIDNIVAIHLNLKLIRV